MPKQIHNFHNDSLIDSLVTLYLKPLYIMHCQSSFNALIIHCNSPYNALHDLMNNRNHSYNTLEYVMLLESIMH